MKNMPRREVLRSVLTGAAVLALPKFLYSSGVQTAVTPAESVFDAKEQKIVNFLTDFLRNDPLNKLPDFDDARIWEDPLFGFASAQDPIFEKLKTPGIVGPKHHSPTEWLPDAKTVICFFLPFSEKIRKSNRQIGDPSFGWVSARCNGEPHKNLVAGKALWEFIEKNLGGKIVQPSTDMRFKPKGAVPNPSAPDAAGTAAAYNEVKPADPNSPEAKQQAKDRFIPAWSERHAAYIAGLGTFGVNKSLITVKGTAGRLGSLITNLELKPTPRPYKEYYSYCPFLVNGGCGACISRCPPRAIVEGKEKDDLLCASYTRTKLAEPKYKKYPHGCGKCVTAVPCESRIPPPDLKRMVNFSCEACSQEVFA